MNFFGHNPMDFFANQPTYKLFCKAGGNWFSMAVRENKVVLVHSDANHDTQHWYKDERFSTEARDEQGHPSFALVNKATGMVIKHPVIGEPVTLVPFNPYAGLDLSLLWTESDDVGEGFKNIRAVDDHKGAMDAFHGDQDHGGVQDGTCVALYDFWNGDNQKWKLCPYSNDCQDPAEVPTSNYTLEMPLLRETLEQVIREMDEEQSLGEKHDAYAWEMVNSEVVGRLMGTAFEHEHQSDPYPVGPLDQEDLEDGYCPTSVGSMVLQGDDSEPQQRVRQRLDKVFVNPILGTRPESAIFNPQWDITRDDSLTDAFSQRSIALCHQWCKEIVPPKDYQDLLGLGLDELYHWADYHKAQAHIFEMVARDKAGLLFLGEQALRETAEKRFSAERYSDNQGSPRLEINDKITAKQIEAVQKLEKDKADLVYQLRNLEIKCSEQEGQLKDQASSFQSELEELKKAAQMNCAEQETRLREANLSICSLRKDLEERSLQLAILQKKIATLEARSAERLKLKMDIVIRAIMRRHHDLDWETILDDIDQMNAKLDSLSVSEVPSSRVTPQKSQL